MPGNLLHYMGSASPGCFVRPQVANFNASAAPGDKTIKGSTFKKLTAGSNCAIKYNLNKDNVRKSRLDNYPQRITNKCNHTTAQNDIFPIAHRPDKNTTNALAFRQRLMENGKQNGEKLAQILQADWSYATVCAILIKQEHIGLINKILPEHQIIPLLVIIYNINNLAKNQQTIVYDAVVRIIDSWSKYTLAPEKLKYLRDQAWTAISCSLPSEFCAAKRLGVAIELLAQRTHVSHDAFERIVFNLVRQYHHFQQQGRPADYFVVENIFFAALFCKEPQRHKVLRMTIDCLLSCSGNKVNYLMGLIYQFIQLGIEKIERFILADKIDVIVSLREMKFPVGVANHNYIRHYTKYKDLRITKNKARS